MPLSVLGLATPQSMPRSLASNGRYVNIFGLPCVVVLRLFRPACQGKIMRRILRKIAEGEADKLGDTSTLADPSIVDVSVDVV